MSPYRDILHSSSFGDEAADGELSRRFRALVDMAGGPSKVALATGFSRNALHKWSTGRSRIPFDAVAAVARVAGVSVDWLVTGDEADVRATAPRTSGESDVFATVAKTSNDVRDTASRTLEAPDDERRTVRRTSETPDDVRATAPRTSEAPDDERPTPGRSSKTPSSTPPELTAAVARIDADLLHPIDPTEGLGAASIPTIDARAAAGGGAWNDAEAEISRTAFPLAWLRKLGGPATKAKNCEFLRAYGDSMTPTIASGALMLIDRGQTRPPPGQGAKRRRDDDIFVFAAGSEVRVKRLMLFENDFLGVFSDNSADYPPTLVSAEEARDFRIIGRVIWWDNRL